MTDAERDEAVELGDEGEGPADAAVARTDDQSEATRPLYVVGLGASAGGLEALEKFFDNMRPDSGLAFVVIQHLSPDFRSLMDELLSRHTEIAFHRVEDGMEVQPNTIYLMPPKKEMIISGGRLLVTDKDPKQGLVLPIDVFFRSLAQDAGDRAVGIVLSGTGSDGARGIRAIHEAGGLVIAQSEETAKFDGMPRSAVDTGVVDHVLAPEEMPERLLRYTAHPEHRGEAAETDKSPVSEEGMDAILRFLRDEYGIDFSHYKPNTVTRRVQRRLGLNRAFDLDDYVERLRGDPGELNSLYKDLLIGVTKFFRDAEAFEHLEHDVIPQLLMKVPSGEALRVWVAGCATGEEAYSIAMLIHEQLAATRRPVEVKIFATDVHRASLEFASAGIYCEDALSEVNEARLGHYFRRHGAGFQVSQDLRKMIVFAPQNVIKDAPFTKLDLITCRNLLIYLQAAAQKKALSLFHFGLKTGGVLFLGPSESPGELSDEFEPIEHHWKIFRKRRDSRLPADLRLPLSPGFRPEAPALGRGAAAGYADARLMKTYDALLDEFVPPSILINDRRELVHTFGGAGKYLAVRDGRPSADVLEMVDPELKLALTGAIQRVSKEKKPVSFTGIRIATAGSEEQLKLTVQPISHRDAPAHMLITLASMARREAPRDESSELDLDEVSRERIVALEAELRYTKENLQATVEEMETSNEELQATNEELVASNEELQSTNEELHSVNEELYTVNAEYQRKINELTELNDDLDNLFCSTEVGTIFLDRELRIRKFTPKASECFHILPQDVGRRLDAFTHDLDFDDLSGVVARVLETEELFEHEVRNRAGQWSLLRVLPYRSKERVEGVVFSLVDLSSLKAAERQLRLMSKVFMDGADPIIIEDLDGRILEVNSEAERVYGWTRRELLGEDIRLLIPPRQQAEGEELRRRCRADDHLRNVESVRVTKSGDVRPVLLALSLLTDEAGEPAAIASIAKDITQRKQAEQSCRRYAEKLEAINDELRHNVAEREKAEARAMEEVRRRDRFLAMLSHELRNPLGAILNATRVMDRDEADDAVVEEARHVVGRQGNQMARLLADLLDVSRVTQGKIEIRRDMVDVADTVRDAVAAVRSLVDEHGQQLTVSVGEGPLRVRGDAARLQQIQVNLLTNAAKYTPAEGRIELNVFRENEEVVIRVRDDGVGIPPDMQERIFELFVQSGESLDRADGGMGVGLTLVRNLVELHGGRIGVQSDGPGQGSQFVVRLPVCPEEELPEGTADESGPAEKVSKVLIVEDNDDSREMLQTLLELDGYQVHVAKDGRGALDALVREPFDVALIDIGLPEMDGYQLAREVRAGKHNQAARLVALTGYGRPADHQAVLEAGFDEHLVKPVDPDDLSRVLGRPR